MEMESEELTLLCEHGFMYGSDGNGRMCGGCPPNARFRVARLISRGLVPPLLQSGSGT